MPKVGRRWPYAAGSSASDQSSSFSFQGERSLRLSLCPSGYPSLLLPAVCDSKKNHTGTLMTDQMCTRSNSSRSSGSTRFIESPFATDTSECNRGTQEGSPMNSLCVESRSEWESSRSSLLCPTPTAPCTSETAEHAVRCSNTDDDV